MSSHQATPKQGSAALISPRGAWAWATATQRSSVWGSRCRARSQHCFGVPTMSPMTTATWPKPKKERGCPTFRGGISAPLETTTAPFRVAWATRS